MQKKLKKRGKNIFVKVEIQNISKEGIWILIDDREFFLSFTHYLWFQKATIEQIYDFQFLHQKHLHWPHLDIDIELDSLKYPATYTLIYK
jgi:hypothetical protein